MTKQQSTTTADTDGYPVNREDLLDFYTRTEDVIEEFRKINDATGITRETYDYFAKLDQFGKPERVKRAPISDTLLRYEEPSYKQVKHLRWLANVTNRDRTFRTPQDLVNDHSITPQELELFNSGNKGGDKSLPRREITQLKRHKLTDGSEWITRVERWYGLTKSCAVVTCPVDLGWYYYPSHENEFVQTDPNNPNSPTARVIRLKYGPGGSFVGEPRYTDPYTPEKMKFYQKQLQGQPGTDYSFSLIKEGHYGGVGVTDPVKFAERPFDGLWKELTSPKTNTVQFNPDDFSAYQEFLEYKRAMAEKEKGKDKNSNKDKEDAYR